MSEPRIDEIPEPALERPLPRFDSGVEFVPFHATLPSETQPKEEHMPTQIFVNLPVKDLTRTVAFFTRLGFTFNPQFTDENATCMIVGENIFVMLLVEPFFRTFTDKALCDARRSTEAITSLSVGSRATVDDLVARAIAAGGTAPRSAQDHGFMYQHGFEDLDGHLWELVWMDPNAQPPH
jgi:predicted lactoylglutathione lyase